MCLRPSIAIDASSMRRDARAYIEDIVDLRYQLIHECVRVNDAVAWGAVEDNVATLRDECARLLPELDLDSPDH